MVYVKLKWGLEYRGYLLSSDAYMNLQLEQCEEFIEGASQGNLGEVLIRCASELLFLLRCGRVALRRSRACGGARRGVGAVLMRRCITRVCAAAASAL